MVSKRLMLSSPERRELRRRLRSRRVRSEDARRADVILRSARGQSVREIARGFGVQHFICAALDQSVPPDTLERSGRPASRA